MKLKQILLIISVFVVSFGAIAQTKTTNVSQSNSQTLTKKILTLEQNTQEEILLIQTDIQSINNSIDEIQTTTIANTALIQDTTEKTHKQITIWFAVLAGVISFISIACPLIVNISYQKYYFDKQVKQLQKNIDIIKNDVNSTQINAAAAQTSLNKIEDLDKKLTILQQEVKRSQLKANRAAQRALASKFFTEALAEHDKNPQKAIDLYTKFINIDNLNADAYNNRGVLYKQVGRVQEALEDYNKAIELNSNDADVFNNRGNLYKELGDTKKALENYNRAIEINPSEAGIYNNRGILYASLGNVEKALEDYNKAIELDPTDAVMYDNRGVLYAKIEDTENALKDYNQSIEINPNESLVYNNRADLWLKLKQYENALTDIHHAIKLKSSEAIYYVTKGEIYLAMKKYNDAISLFNQAVLLDKNNEEAYILRAECYRKLANRSRNKTKKAEYIALAELDDIKINQLKNKND